MVVINWRARSKLRFMMWMWWMSGPRRRRARRMCQRAWAPAPKTQMVWTVVRRVKMMVEARAVRKAVREEAARKA